MALGEVKISDGTDTVFFSPGATVKRTLDKHDGLSIMATGRNSTPKSNDFKRAHDIIQVDTTFLNRFDDYQTLFNMLKEIPNADKFTFTWGVETFTVVSPMLIVEQTEGTGEERSIHCEMEVVRD